VQDILGKLGGQAGQQGGLDNIQGLFGGNGLQGIVSHLTKAGLGKQVQSWIASGKNLPVDAQMIQQAMDPAKLRQLSQATGMAPEQISEHVARVLPQLIDEATPSGQLPASDPFSKGASALKSTATSR
jgi:uncharacterized protein YidB (DUF937 family)